MSDEDRRVVALSIRDTQASLNPAPSRFLSDWLLPRPSNQLANPRLEALRRYAILYRLGVVVRDAAAETALASVGYDESQRREAEALVRQLAPGYLSPAMPRRESRWLWLLAAPSIAGCIWIDALVEDLAIALVMVGTLSVAAAGLFARRSA